MFKSGSGILERYGTTTSYACEGINDKHTISPVAQIRLYTFSNSIGLVADEISSSLKIICMHFLRNKLYRQLQFDDFFQIFSSYPSA